MRRVVGTGIGVASPHGVGRRAFGAAVGEGRAGRARVGGFEQFGRAGRDRGGGQGLEGVACIAAAQAVGEAFRLIARGDADVMLAGGCDSRLDPLMLVAYQAMNAVSRSTRPATEVSRPFDGERDGFVLGEGAAVLILESLQ